MNVRVIRIAEEPVIIDEAGKVLGENGVEQTKQSLLNPGMPEEKKCHLTTVKLGNYDMEAVSEMLEIPDAEEAIIFLAESGKFGMFVK